MEIEKTAAYKKIPDDWWVLSTDIKGSTKAISEGRYKEVNTLGVSAIISVQNALKSDQFPFIFGGDGATLLVPEMHLTRALEALSYTRSISKSTFGFDLRVSRVSMREIRQQKKDIAIAVLQNKDKQRVFLFKGGGITAAEDLMKSNTKYDLPEDYKINGSHEGLECRWNPVPASRGQILSLIIQPVHDGSVVEDFLLKFEPILRQAQPIKASTIPVSWPPKHLYAEARAKGKGFVFKLRALLYLLLLWPLILLGRNKVGSAVEIYLLQLQNNTDFMKRDDSLRLVIDITPQEKKEIIGYLETLKDKGEIHYGYFESTTTLMTCLVRSSKDHFHFVDGSDGGYVQAATMLKNSKKQKI